LILYVDDILLTGNNVGILSFIKVWLSNQFSTKDIEEANYVIGTKFLRNRK
jgi:hypothetical protein